MARSAGETFAIEAARFPSLRIGGGLAGGRVASVGTRGWAVGAIDRGVGFGSLIGDAVRVWVGVTFWS